MLRICGPFFFLKHYIFEFLIERMDLDASAEFRSQAGNNLSVSKPDLSEVSRVGWLTSLGFYILFCAAEQAEFPVVDVEKQTISQVNISEVFTERVTKGLGLCSLSTHAPAACTHCDLRPL